MHGNSNKFRVVKPSEFSTETNPCDDTNMVCYRILTNFVRNENRKQTIPKTRGRKKRNPANIAWSDRRKLDLEQVLTIEIVLSRIIENFTHFSSITNYRHRSIRNCHKLSKSEIINRVYSPMFIRLPILTIGPFVLLSNCKWTTQFLLVVFASSP